MYGAFTRNHRNANHTKNTLTNEREKNNENLVQFVFVIQMLICITKVMARERTI